MQQLIPLRTTSECVILNVCVHSFSFACVSLFMRIKILPVRGLSEGGCPIFFCAISSPRLFVYTLCKCTFVKKLMLKKVSDSFYEQPDTF